MKFENENEMTAWIKKNWLYILLVFVGLIFAKQWVDKGKYQVVEVYRFNGKENMRTFIILDTSTGDYTSPWDK